MSKRSNSKTKKYEYDYEAIDFTYEGKRYKARGKPDEKLIAKLIEQGADAETIEAERKASALEDAKSKKLEKIAAIDAGKAAYTKDKNIRFKDYAKEWEDTYNKNIEAQSRKDIHYRIEKFILPYLGHIRMKDITRTEIVKMLNGMSGYSKDRIMKTRQTLKQILEAAYDDGYLPRIPNVKKDDIPETPEPEMKRAILPYERELTLKVAKYHHAGPWILTMLYTGIRPQEAAALQGRHINFKDMTITIEQARKRDDYVDKPKSNAGKRVIPIPIQLLPFLPRVGPFEFVFRTRKWTTKDGKPMGDKWLNLSNQRRLWESFLREMNIQAGNRVYNNALVPSMELVPGCGHSCLLLYPDYIRDGFGKRDYPIMDDVTPYIYRHTYGCDCAAAGMDIDLLSKLMGHANIAITAKYYLHLTDERLNQAAELLAAYHMKDGQQGHDNKMA